MKKKRNKNFGKVIIWSLCLFPFIFHLSWLVYSDWRFNEVKKGKDVILAKFPQKEAVNPNVSPIKILGTYGDIYQPKIKNSERRYDMIILSATIDPLYTVEGMLVLQTNVLVHTFFMYAYGDSTLAESGLRNLIIRMLKNNRRYVDFLLSEPVRKIAYNIEYAVEICEPFIARVPEGSRLWRDGVKWYAVLPLFNPHTEISDNTELIQKLSLNVTTAVMRLFKDLAQLSDKYAEYRIRTIAFPALGGISGLFSKDWVAFTYQKSFESIFQGIEGSVLPLSVEAIYFVGWDKAKFYFNNPLEENCIIAALKNIYNKFWFNRWPIALLGYSILILFCFAYLFKRWEKRNLKNTSLLDLLFVLLIVVISLLGNFAVVGKFITLFFKYILNAWGVLLTLIVEVIVGIFSVVLGSKLSTLKFKKTKKFILND